MQISKQKNYYRLSGRFKNVAQKSRLRKEKERLEKILDQTSKFIQATKDYEGKWKLIDENPNYTIFDDGRIWSHKASKFIATANHVLGYIFAGPKVRVDGAKKKRQMTLHRLVARNFIPNPEKHREINHKDGDKKNNHVSNLEWCSRKMNMVHASENGLLAKKPTVPTKSTIQEVPDNWLVCVK